MSATESCGCPAGTAIVPTSGHGDMWRCRGCNRSGQRRGDSICLAVPTPPAFKVGDRVRMVGHRDVLGAVLEAGSTLRVRWDSDGFVSRLYASDIELLPPQPEAGKFKVGDWVKLYGTSERVPTKYRIESIDGGAAMLCDPKGFRFAHSLSDLRPTDASDPPGYPAPARANINFVAREWSDASGNQLNVYEDGTIAVRRKGSAIQFTLEGSADATKLLTDILDHVTQRAKAAGEASDKVMSKNQRLADKCGDLHEQLRVLNEYCTEGWAIVGKLRRELERKNGKR